MKQYFFADEKIQNLKTKKIEKVTTRQQIIARRGHGIKKLVLKRTFFRRWFQKSNFEVKKLKA